MKRILTIIATVFCMHLNAQVDSSNYMTGNVLYEQGNYKDAIIVYENVIKENGYSSEVNYNLGNCYYKTGELGKSILNYERALQLDPGDGDIRYNLDLANLRTRDRLSKVDDVIFAIWWRNIFNLFPSSLWATLSILFLWFAAAGLGVYRFAGQLRLQKTGFYVMFAAALLFIFTFAAGLGQHRYNTTHRYAIVMEPSAILKSEPNESSTNLTLIHEGLKVQLLDVQGDWTEVKMEDGNEGWVMGSAIEQI